MAIARYNLIRTDHEGTYHCISRCVRRAFLCGHDKLTNRNFDHRKQWLYQRLVELAGIFLIDVCGYAIMENHLHVILRNRPDLAVAATDDTIARRWWQLFPKRRTPTHAPEEPSDLELSLILSSPGRVALLRQRLSSISWFMGSLKEDIAKRANAEDLVTGRFWEGRFKSIALLDRAAILACTAYVDLNPIRAGLADSPETSEFTSAKERITTQRAVEIHKSIIRTDGKDAVIPKDIISLSEGDKWLCPLKTSKHRRGFLEIELDQYLNLLNWTAQQIVAKKRDAIPRHLAPTLASLNIDHKEWLEASQHFGSLFYRAAGRAAHMAQKAIAVGQHWLKGIQASRTLFLTE